jgi:DNA-binding NarL/FixJ family response regulator
MKISIGIVDDSIRHRLLLEEQIGYAPDFSVCLTADNGSDFLEKIAHLSLQQQPMVVLMDIEMPGMKGTEAVRIARRSYPGVKFLMLTVFDDDEKIFEAIRLGASGYLLKDEKTSSILEHIRQLVNLGGAPMSPTIARKALDLLSRSVPETGTSQELPGMISKREREVLELLVGGKDYKAIAEKLFVSHNTIRTHIANIYEKLHVSSKTEVVTMALQRKWFEK